MALEISTLRFSKAPGGLTSPARLYLTADDKVVGAGEPGAVKLLVGEGGTIPREVAAKYGLVSGKGRLAAAAAEEESKQETTPRVTQSKAGKTPANKSRKRTAKDK